MYKTGVPTSFQLQLKGMIQPFKITQQTHLKNQHLTSEKNENKHLRITLNK